jgi:4-hydroxybenzoate polyprenyltransferase
LSRFDRPIGWWLLLLPCWWSAALATASNHRLAELPWHLALFLIGAIVMRGAGCTWNDITDRDLDAQVARTRSRPLPSGQVRVRSAFLFLLLQALIGLLVLVQFNLATIITGVASLAIVAVYPFMKRVTYWPQVVLGLAFSWGALMGWVASTGRIEGPALALYAGSIAWVIGYDTIYAHQDRDDDALIGVKSTALLFGARTRPILAGFFATAIAFIALALVRAQIGWGGYLGLAAFALHLGWQVRSLDINNPDHCLMLFKSNRDAGLLLFVGLVIDAIVRSL